MSTEIDLVSKIAETKAIKSNLQNCFQKVCR